jgi:hypothetical protein
MDGLGPIPSHRPTDFRANLSPSRSWILGEDPDQPGRVEVLTIADPREDVPVSAATEPPAAEASDCGCPEFCERDHANE